MRTRLNAPSGLLAGAALGMIGILWQGVIRVGVNAVIGRSAGPAALGAVATGLAIAQIASLLGPTSAGSAASKFIPRFVGAGQPELSVGAATYLAKVVATAALLTSIAAAGLWLVLTPGDVTGALSVTTLVIGLAGWTYGRGVLFGMGQFRRATALDLLSGSVAIVLVLILSGSRMLGVSALAAIGASYLLYAVLAWPFKLRAERVPAPIRKEMKSFLALGVLGTVASAGFLQLAVLAARLFEGVESAGQFSAAMTVATPLGLVSSGLAMVLFPSLSRLSGGNQVKEFRARTHSSMRVNAALTSLIYGCAFIVGPSVVRAVWGPSFADAGPLLLGLVLAFSLSSASVPAVNALTSSTSRGVLLSAKYSTSGAVVGCLSWVVLIPTFGIFGVLLGYGLGVAIIGIAPIWHVWREEAYTWWPLVRGFLICLGMAGACFAVSRLADVNSVLCACLFGGLWILMHRELLRDIRKQRSAA